jgi:DNA-binding GntR family transcriptional regulator
MPSAAQHESVFQILRSAVEEGRLPSGQVLQEQALARRLGVHQSAVRRALARLQDTGLARPLARQGYVVAGRAEAHRIDLPPLPALPSPRPAPRRPDEPRWHTIAREVEGALAPLLAAGRFAVVEHALARHFGVTRTVAREVLVHLQAGGLVLREEARWVTLALTPCRADDLYALRLALEPPALREAADLIPPGALHLAAERLERAASGRPSPAELDALEVELHDHLPSHAPNCDLVRLLGQSRALLLVGHAVLGRAADVEDLLGEHDRILGLLRLGRARQAALRLEAHLAATAAAHRARIAALAARPAPAVPPYLVAMRPETRRSRAP